MWIASRINAKLLKIGQSTKLVTSQTPSPLNKKVTLDVSNDTWAISLKVKIFFTCNMFCKYMLDQQKNTFFQTLTKLDVMKYTTLITKRDSLVYIKKRQRSLSL
jgi:hypothetical protein